MPLRSVSPASSTLLIAGALLTGAPAAVGAATTGGEAVVRACVQGTLETTTYSPADYRAALAELPSDLDEYTDCRDQIKAARDAAVRGGSPKDVAATTKKMAEILGQSVAGAPDQPAPSSLQPAEPPATVPIATPLNSGELPSAVLAAGPSVPDRGTLATVPAGLAGLVVAASAGLLLRRRPAADQPELPQP